MSSVRVRSATPPYLITSVYNVNVRENQSGISSILIILLVIVLIVTGFSYMYSKKSLTQNVINNKERIEKSIAEEKSEELLFYENAHPNLSFSYPDFYGSVVPGDVKGGAGEGEYWSITFSKRAHPHMYLFATSSNFVPMHWEGPPHWVNQVINLNSLEDLVKYFDKEHDEVISIENISNDYGVEGAHLWFWGCHGCCIPISMIVVPITNENYNNLVITYYPDIEDALFCDKEIEEMKKSINTSDYDITNQFLLFNSLQLR